MQRLKFVFPTLLLLLVIVSGCADKTTRSFLANTPVYTPTETWRAQAFTFEATRALKTPGKIYLYNNLLLVNEFLEGVHFYDNSNPASPIELGFLPVDRLQRREVEVRVDESTTRAAAIPAEQYLCFQ